MGFVRTITGSVGRYCSATRFLRNSDRILEKKAPVLRNISEARSLASAAPKTAGRPTQEGGLSPSMTPRGAFRL